MESHEDLSSRFFCFFIQALLDLFAAHEEGIWRNAFHEEDISADRTSGTDNSIATEDDAIWINCDIVLNFRMAFEAFNNSAGLVFLEAAGTEGHSVVEFNSVADFACFTDDDAGPVVDKKMGADAGAGMDIDSGPAMRPFGDHARDQRNVIAVEQVG